MATKRKTVIVIGNRKASVPRANIRRAVKAAKKRLAEKEASAA